MGNLIRMDLYRMRKAKTFIVCLILTFFLAVAIAPIGKLLTILAKTLSPDANIIPYAETANLSDIISNPFPFLGAMLLMISACSFFYADVENGYIKNIAGQMPRRGYTIVSKFLCVIPHNLLFMLAGVLGNLAGTLLVQRIVVDAKVAESIASFFLKLLLVQSICALLVLFVSALRNKSLGMVFAVVLGMSLMTLIYSLIDTGIAQLFKDAGPIFTKYMPDQIMGEKYPNALTAILVAAGFIVVFLGTAIRVFDKRDVT